MSFKNNYFNGSAFWKTLGHFLIKLSMPSIIWLQNSTPEYLPKVKTWFHTKTGVQMITVAFLTSPKLEASQVSFIWGMYKAVMHLYHGIHLHHGILLRTKGRDCGYTQEHEWISNALCYVKKKNPNAERLPPPVSFHLCDILTDEVTENRWMIAWGWSGRDMRGELGMMEVFCLVSEVTEGVPPTDSIHLEVNFTVCSL